MQQFLTFSQLLSPVNNMSFTILRYRPTHSASLWLKLLVVYLTLLSSHPRPSTVARSQQGFPANLREKTVGQIRQTKRRRYFCTVVDNTVMDLDEKVLPTCTHEKTCDSFLQIFYIIFLQHIFSNQISFLFQKDKQ